MLVTRHRVARRWYASVAVGVALLLLSLVVTWTSRHGTQSAIGSGPARPVGSSAGSASTGRMPTTLPARGIAGARPSRSATPGAPATSAGGKPTALNTGVPAGVRLRVVYSD